MNTRFRRWGVCSSFIFLAFSKPKRALQFAKFAWHALSDAKTFWHIPDVNTLLLRRKLKEAKDLSRVFVYASFRRELYITYRSALTDLEESLSSHSIS